MSDGRAFRTRERAASLQSCGPKPASCWSNPACSRCCRTRFGKAMVTGSAGYDLMVWRDIDIHMPCEADRWAEWAALGGEIASQFRAAGLTLHKASFLNDYVDPHPLGAGLYWGIEFARLRR